MESYDLFLILLLSWPLCWASYLIFAKNEAGIAKVNSVGDWLLNKQNQYAIESSFFSKYILASLLWPIKKLIKMTENIEDVFKQGGLRTLAFGYYGIAIGYLITAVVFGLVVLVLGLLALWFALFVLGEMSKEEGSSRVLNSRKKTGFSLFGDDKYVETTDEEGNVISESRKKTDWFGDKYIETTDKEGNVISESRNKDGFSLFGDDKYVETTDEEGNVISESRNKDGFSLFGDDKYVETTDEEGNVISESRNKHGFSLFGDDKYVETKQKK